MPIEVPAGGPGVGDDMRVGFILLVFAGLIVRTNEAAFAGSAAAGGKPNIVLIVSDDQGYNDLSCLGPGEIRTPRLDRLAAEGVRGTNFYVTWPACTPSRGSILTGRYPQRNGLYDMIRNDLVNYRFQFDEYTYAVSPEMTLGMDLREVMISEVLHDAGYATGVFGKWDGGRAQRFLPRQRGFDAFFGFANTGIDYFTHERYGVPSMFRDNEQVKVAGYATELFKVEALRFIDQHHEQPFFLYIPFNAPHGASTFEERGAQAPAAYIRETYPEGDPAERRTRYMACVTYMDDCIGEVLDRLDHYELSDKTLVIFFSDNGGSGIADNSPLRGRKGLMFEGGVRVPFIAKLPGVIPAGTVSTEFLTALELFPTLAKVAGAKLPDGVVYDGFDMLAVLAGEAESKRKEMFWQRRGDKAARVGRYKWIDSQKGGGLFDLSQDIGERNDLSEEEPERLAELKSRFANWQAEMEAAEPRGPFRNY